MRILLIAILCCFLPVSSFSQQATKIASFTNVLCEEYLAEMDSVIIQAQNDPKATIHVFVYDGKERGKYDSRKRTFVLVAPNYGSARAKIWSMKRYLAMRKAPVDRFSFVEAGFNQLMTVEFWLVPEGSTPPKPNPSITKMKYRDGKARGFCLDCCG